eukprot:scaffold107746_cov116-Phaeocystis_antarctica.AAC.1
MFTSSGAWTAAAGLEAAEGRLRSADSLEAAAESLGPAAGCVAAAENLGPTGGLETVAAYELDLITAGEAAAQGSSGPNAAAVDSAPGAADGSSVFEQTALGSSTAASFERWKVTPSASTTQTGPACP